MAARDRFILLGLIVGAVMLAGSFVYAGLWYILIRGVMNGWTVALILIPAAGLASFFWGLDRWVERPPARINNKAFTEAVVDRVRTDDTIRIVRAEGASAAQGWFLDGIPRDHLSIIAVELARGASFSNSLISQTDLTRGQYEALRGALIKAGFLSLKIPGVPSQGFQLTDDGRGLFQTLALEEGFKISPAEDGDLEY